MKYLSVCSGIEAATVAWHDLGWRPFGFSEIEPFPAKVLAHYYPDIPNFGDMNEFKNWPDSDIDVLVGGTPCQSFSVAGLRAGMADPRGNLALVYLAIAAKYSPRWLVWENVPGVLSSDGGRDFGAIIGGMVELGYSPCWRVLDAQYFGVPQRRRRVFVVASSRGWRDSAKVLFEPQSLRRNPPPSRETRQGFAADATGGAPGSSEGSPDGAGRDWPADVAATMNAAYGSKNGLEDQHALGGASYFVPERMGTLTSRMMMSLGSRDIEDGAVMPMHIQDVADPLSANEQKTYTHEGKGNFRTRNVQAYGIPSNWIGRKPENGGNGSQPMNNVSPTLTRADRHAVAHPLTAEHDSSEDGTGRGTPLVAAPLTAGSSKPGVSAPGRRQEDDHNLVAGFAQNQRDEVRTMDVAGALAAEPGAKQQTYVFKQGAGAKAGSIGGSEHTAPTLGASDSGTQLSPALMSNMAVRRLTPTECERLQGFPDGYTAIPGASDGARYKSLGNSMAVPVMRWIAERIDAVDKGEA